MKLSCPSCGAKYSIADEKVHDRLAKIRCRKCSATIIIDGKVSPPNIHTSEGGSQAADAGDGGSPGPAAGEYSVDFGDNDQRTMTADDIAQAYRRGELTRETYVWAEGMSDWTAIGDVPELASALDSASTAAAPSPAQPRAAARSGSGRGSAHDLFGGIETAGSESDITTSAPQPAPSPVATGARNESSVLFSLSALTASAGSPTAPTKTSASMAESKVDDSGLIDLKALTSSVANQAPVGPLGLGTAPLGMAAPLGGITAPAVSTDDHMSRPQGSKTGLYIAGALVFVGALIAGAIVFTSSKEAPAAAASAVTTPAVTAAPVAPTAEPKKEELAAPPSTGTAETPAAPSASGALAKNTPAPKSKGGGGSKKPVGGGGGAVEKPAPTPPPASEPSEPKPKPKPKSNACNCGPGDLMCAMKCAAGH